MGGNFDRIGLADDKNKLPAFVQSTTKLLVPTTWAVSRPGVLPLHCEHHTCVCHKFAFYCKE